MRVHLQQAEKATGHHPVELDAVEIPPGGEWLWECYWELRHGEPITLAEIEALCRLRNITFTPWEIGTLRAMDTALESEMVKQREK